MIDSLGVSMSEARKHARRWYRFPLGTVLGIVAIAAIAIYLVALRFRDVFFHDFYIR